MPRLIDHAQRERAIGEAAWRVLVRDGLPALSVRNVAEEAGLATASLRRSFPTQAALRAWCLDLVTERVTARLLTVPESLAPRDYVEACLIELLPLDVERRVEFEVQVAMEALVATDPDVGRAYRRAHDLLAAGCASLVATLARDPHYAHLRSDAADAADAAATLHALLDGLALHLLRDPDRSAGAERTLRLLRRHLDSLRVR